MVEMVELVELVEADEGTMPNSSDCKRQLCKRYMLADPGNDRMSQ
jgi:hypothetical protein